MKRNLPFLFLLIVYFVTNAQLKFYPSINSVGYSYDRGFHSDSLYPGASAAVLYGKSLIGMISGFAPSSTKNYNKNEFRGSLFNLEPNAKYYFSIKILWGDGSFDFKVDSVTTKAETSIQPSSNIKYVSPTGTGNSYTNATPGDLKTLLAAGLACGTTVFLKGGTYNTGEMQLNLLQDCNSGAPIIIMAAPGETPVLDGGDYTKYTWAKSTNDSNLYYTTIKQELSYNSLCMMDSTRLYPYAYLTPNSIDPSYPCLSNLNFDLSGFYRNANLVYIKTLDHKNPNNSQIVFSGHFSCLQVLGNRKNNYIYIKGITFKNYGKGICNIDAFGNPVSCYPSYGLYFERASHVLIDSCRFEYCNSPITFGHLSNENIVQNCSFLDGVGEWSHGAFKQTRDENVFEHGSFGRYLEYSSIHLFPDDTVQTGNIIRNNYVKGSIGGLVGERVTGFEGIEETDIYNNHVTYSYNGINADGGSVNTRIWGNEVDHCSVGLSFISALGGPNYIFRNSIHHIIERKNYHFDVFFMDCNNVLSSKIWGTGVKLNATAATANPPEMFFINNTFHSNDSLGFCMYLWDHTWKKLFSRNNIFYSEGLSSLFFDSPKNDTLYSFNSWNDCYFNKTNGKIAIIQPTNGIAVCNSFIDGSGLESEFKHVSGSKDISVRFEFVMNPNFVNPSFDYHLKNNSYLVDQGMVIRGVNDDFKGGGPDIGAFETDTSKGNGINSWKANSKHRLRVYPNPVINELNLTNYNASAPGSDFIIYNILGQKMLEGKLSEMKTVINVSSFPAAVYFIRVGEEVISFVKE